MRKGLKKGLAIFAAAAMTAGALSLAACGYQFTPLTGGPGADDAVVSNGGFVVEKGDYIYFINGIETQESDNTYGTPVKGALMRMNKSDVLAGKSKDENGNPTAETVVPSLMVAGDYYSGLYIYGDRIYYATPNNVRNTSGVVETNFLDFKSAKLDGSDIKDHFRISDRESDYRFIQLEKNGPVYVAYQSGSGEVHSYNLSTDTDTTLFAGATDYTFSTTDKGDAWIYYTMPVREGLDTDTYYSPGYNQIYRVSVDTTEAPYAYTWDQDYLDEHDGKAPYTNLGTIVLDGIGRFDGTDSETRPVFDSQFTHDLAGLDGSKYPLAPAGYTYTLQSYANGGIYFTRSELTKTGSPGEAAQLFYLPQDQLSEKWNAETGEGWNSIKGNEIKTADTAGSIEMVALAENTSKANRGAIFYLDDEGHHHYLYVADNNIYRADVDPDGSGRIINDKDGKATPENGTGMRIARGVSGATLQFIDIRDDYSYVYFTRSGASGGLTVERAVFDSAAFYDAEGSFKEDSGLYYGDVPFKDYDQAPYKNVKVLNVEHASGWYPYEVVDGILYYADAETYAGTAYTYVSCVNLRGSEGKLMTNAEIETKLNDAWNKIMDSDKKVGYLAKLTDDGEGNLSTAMKYYFYTGETNLFDSNIKDAVDAGKEETYLYTADEQARFKEFAKTGTVDGKEFGDTRTRSHFITKLGVWTEDDEEALEEYWRTTIRFYTPEEETEEGLEDWALALIIVAVLLVVAGAALTAVLVVLKKRKEEKKAAARPKRMRVDTTDDKSVDVYATEPEELTEPAGEPTEDPAEEIAEEITEEFAETVETPAETEAPAEPEPEAPAEPETPAEPEAEAPAEEPEAPAPEAPAEDEPHSEE